MNLKIAFPAWLATAAVLPFLLSTNAQVPGGSLDPLKIPKFVDPLVIPPVLYDDLGGTAPLNVEIAFRQFSQQVLPSTGCTVAAIPGVVCVGDAFPKTELWGYGNPANAATFNNPAFTVEVTQNTPSRVKWTNELVDAAGNFVPHILQDKDKVPIIDQTVHWAAPNGGCMDPGMTKDCHTVNPGPYTGPIPMVVHVHGAHVGAGSDGEFTCRDARN